MTQTDEKAFETGIEQHPLDKGGYVRTSVAATLVSVGLPRTITWAF